MLQTLSCYVFSFVLSLAWWIWIPTSTHIITTILAIGSTGYLCILFAEIFDRLLPRKRVSPLKKAVFITGCDTGFGHVLAKRLDLRGYKVFAGCFQPNGPDAKKLEKAASSNLTVIDLDVTSDESVQNALRIVNEELENNQLWALVNNAGIIVRGELEWTALEFYKREIEVNTLGVVRVTQAFLPLLRKFRGRVVSLTSYAGRQTYSGYVHYAMSKHAANSFCDGLRQEMKKWDVKVITVEPFAFKTAMTDTKIAEKDIMNTWSKTPEKLKEFYDAEYIDECIKAAIKFNGHAADKNDIVIDCLEEAVTACSPHYSYVPGDMKSILSHWAFRRAPLTAADYFIRKFVTFDADIAEYVERRNRGK